MIREKFLQQARVPLLPHLSPTGTAFLNPGHKWKSNDVAWPATYSLFCPDKSSLIHHSYSPPQELCVLHAVRRGFSLSASQPLSSGHPSLVIIKHFQCTTASPASSLSFLRNDNIYSFPKCVRNKQKILDILISAW